MGSAKGQDITEREEADEALRSARSYLESLFDYARAPIIVWDASGKITRFNHAFERLTGYAAKEVIGREFEILFPTNTKEVSLGRIKKTLTGEFWGSVEIHILRNDGSIRTVLWNSANVYAEDGKTLVATIAQGQDITERKRVEDALHVTEARFDQLAKQSNTVTWEADTDGIFTYVSNVSESVWGYRPDELVGKKHFYDLVVEAERESIKSRAIEMLKHRERFAGLEHAVQTKDGRTVWDSTSGIPLLNADGTLRGYQGSDTDITERKRSEDRLRLLVSKLSAANRDLSQFAYVASHDMQEPLRMISSYLQLLSKRYSGHIDKDADEFINYAVDGANRLQRMIIDLLTYSRIGTRGRAFVETDVGVVLNLALTNLKIAIEASHAKITYANMPTVKADEVQLLQLFQNLIENAVKFRSDEPPAIHVSAERGEGEWVFSVKDNGIGIDPKYQNRLFVVFQRLHSAAKYPGTGIGLALCKRIVERLGGRIWVESELGKGSTFRFTIPDRIEETIGGDLETEIISLDKETEKT